MMDFVKSSGELTTSTLVNTGKALLSGVQIITDSTALATIIVYDETSATGTKLFEGALTGTKIDSQLFNIDPPVKAETGLYVSVAGTGASCIVYYA